MPVVLGLALALVWFVLIDGLMTAVVSSAVRGRELRSAEHSPAVWIALRLMPGVLGATFVAAVFLPSHWRFEPGAANDPTSYSIPAAALVGVALVAAGAWRGLMGLYRTMALSRRLARTARCESGVTCPGSISMHRAHVIDHPYPIVSLVGAFRPRLFISGAVVASLTDAELRAAIDHETAHARAHDNLKRLLLACWPTFSSYTGAGRTLERAWHASAEYAADRFAARRDARQAADLASALVKVARMMPGNLALRGYASMLHDDELLPSRVQRLLDGRPAAAMTVSSRFAWALCGCAVLLACAALIGPAQHLVHAATEGLLRTLP